MNDLNNELGCFWHRLLERCIMKTVAYLLVSSVVVLGFSGWLAARQSAPTTQPISIVDEKRFNAVDRGSYQFLEEIGKNIIISTPIDRKAANDRSIIFKLKDTLGLPAVSVGTSTYNPEQKTSYPDKIAITGTKDIEADGSADVRVVTDRVAKTGTLHIRLASDDDPVLKPKWIQVSTQNPETGEATGLDGAIYVYTPGKGFEPKAK